MKKFLIIISSVVAVLLIALTGAGIYMVGYSLKPEIKDRSDAEAIASLERNYPGLGNWVDSLRTEGILRDTFIVNDNNRILRAFYAAKEGAVGTAVLSHGYTDCALRMMMLGREYRDSLNFNIIAPDHEYHGESEGPAVNMGWHDRLNLELWMEIADELWPDTPMILHGISMGAATVMMCSGDDLPDYVKGIVDDCGYTSVWDEFKGELKNQFGLPAFPLLDVASLICRIKYGWGFKEASALRQVAKSTVPMLFIHGDSDDFVPTWMVEPLYEAKTQGYKQIWLAPGSAHAVAYREHPAEYMSQLRIFVDECLKDCE